MMNPSILEHILERSRAVLLPLALAGSLQGAVGSPATIAQEALSWQPLSAASSSSSAEPSGTQEALRRYAEQARSELEVARRLLEVLSRFEDAGWTQDYVSSLQDILEQAQACMEESREGLVQFAPTLAMHLQMARTTLLEAAPKAKIWIELARAVTPDERLIVPRRLIGPTKHFENELDMDAVMTGAWIRAWVG